MTAPTPLMQRDCGGISSQTGLVLQTKPYYDADRWAGYPWPMDRSLAFHQAFLAAIGTLDRAVTQLRSPLSLPTTVRSTSTA